MIHIDVKKLGRITNGPGHRVTGSRKNKRRTTYTPDGQRIGDAGWEFVHVCVDDFSRLAYAEVLTDEKAATAIAFLKRAGAFYAQHGITIQRLMTETARPTAPTPTPTPAASSGSATSKPSPTGPAQTAKQNASSRP